MPLKHIEVTHIQVSALPGASFGSAVREALMLCSARWSNVILIHRGEKFTIHCNDLLSQVHVVDETGEDQDATNS